MDKEKNRVEKMVDKFKPVFGGSIPKMSDAIKIDRTTLHHAMKRGTFSTDLQKKFLQLSKEHDIEVDASELLNA
tara:strand:- start:16719 stop:16940 length:222 start_codon:yes stop_codon:yes gene_type:complete